MNETSFQDLDDSWQTIEALVDSTPGIDPWCSGPDWILPVHQAFAPESTPLLLSDDAGMVLLARYDMGFAPGLAGLEPLWGFASPLLGPDPALVAHRAAGELATREDWQVLLLPGQPAKATPIDSAPTEGTEKPTEISGDEIIPDKQSLEIAAELTELGSVGFTAGITRQVIDLQMGIDGWMNRRSMRFRRNLRKAEAAADKSGVEIVDVSSQPPKEIFDRLYQLELRSWKGQEGSGIVTPEMATLYRQMIHRLHERNRLHAHIATQGGTDVGFILGGVRGRRYRGLQISYDPTARHLSLGNVLQAHQLRLLCEQDLADTYDLGMDFDYKRRWADHPETSVAIVVHRSP